MRVAVTGATGHIGLNLLPLLLERGHEVRALVFDAPETLCDLPVETIKGSVLNRSDLRRLFDGVEVVFNLAGVISIDGDPDGRVARVNVTGARNVAECALDCGVRRLVHMSSIHAYDLYTGAESIDEESPRVGPRHPPYDRSKNDGERELRRVMERGLDAVILHPSAIIGPNDHRPSFMGQALLELRRGSLPALTDGGFNWVDARDVVSAALAASERGASGKNYFLPGHWKSARGIAEIVADVTGTRPPRWTVSNRVARLSLPLVRPLRRFLPLALYTNESLRTLTASRHISGERAREDLGFHARPLEESIADAYAWFDAQPNGRFAT